MLQVNFTVIYHQARSQPCRAPVNSAQSIRPFLRMKIAREWKLMKVDTGKCYEKFWSHLNVHLDRMWITTTLHEDFHASLLVIFLLHIHLRKIISKIIVKGNQIQTRHCAIFSAALLLKIP
jgi:hypothetical protein